MNEVELHYGGATDIGRVRRTNQDALLAQPPIFVVADGMGGHDDGEVASRIVVERFAEVEAEGLDSTAGARLITATLRASHDQLLTLGEQQRAAGHPDWFAGTTVAAALVVEDEGVPKWLLANLGDSRVYKVKDGVLDQVSVDHSVVQELIDAGEITAAEADDHPRRNVITRSLGGPVLDQVDFFLLPLSSAERLVLCSDGVSGMLTTDELAEVLAASPDPRDAADAAVRAAVEAGGRDNATAIVVDVVGLALPGAAYDAEQQRMSLEEKLGALP